MWERIKHNPALLNLAQTPFLLKIIILAYRDKKILHEKWQRLDAKEHLQHLFNDFVDRKLKEQDRSIAYPEGKEPTPERTKKYLSSIARILEG